MPSIVRASSSDPLFFSLRVGFATKALFTFACIIYTSQGRQVELPVITWNQGHLDGTTTSSSSLGGDSNKLSAHIKNLNTSVAVVCQQESPGPMSAPEGWENVFQNVQIGLTKPQNLKLANIYLTALQRKGATTKIRARGHSSFEGSERVSISGKGGVWAEFQVYLEEEVFPSNFTCSSFVVSCVHLPTAPQERESAVKATLEDAAEEYKADDPQCDDSKVMPSSDCWHVGTTLDAVMITGDLNFRLLPETFGANATNVDFLLDTLLAEKWSVLSAADTIHKSELLSARAGFKCSSPTFLPTYKLQNPEACELLEAGADAGMTRTSLKSCFFPDGLETKHGELQLGWLDRTCWLNNPTVFEPMRERRMTFGSDHAAIETVFQIDISRGHCVAPRSLLSKSLRRTRKASRTQSIPRTFLAASMLDYSQAQFRKKFSVGKDSFKMNEQTSGDAKSEEHEEL